MDGDATLHDEQPTNNPMTVSFRDANGAAVDFKMKPSTKLGKAMAAFSNKIGRDPMQLRFLFDGERVAEEDTPTTVSLVSGWQWWCYADQLLARLAGGRYDRGVHGANRRRRRDC